MTIGTTNTMVRAVKLSVARYALAEVGKRRRKAMERIEPSPLTREQRVQRYANQTGWTNDFTPKQRRRLEHKSNRAKAHPRIQGARPVLTEVDEVQA
jgi:hypothetical protein